MSIPKLFMVLIGCRPPGRAIEQHDIFFGIASAIGDLVPAMINSWPEAKGGIHVDAWRQISHVNGYEVRIQEGVNKSSGAKLFFINLGGYKPGEFEEYHYKMIVAAADKGAAIKLSKETAFFKHTGYKGARAHVDDKYGIDVDDIFAIEDILSSEHKEKYSITLHPAPPGAQEDEQHIGYFRLDKL